MQEAFNFSLSDDAEELQAVTRAMIRSSLSQRDQAMQTEPDEVRTGIPLISSRETLNQSFTYNPPSNFDLQEAPAGMTQRTNNSQRDRMDQMP